LGGGLKLEVGDGRSRRLRRREGEVHARRVIARGCRRYPPAVARLSLGTASREAAKNDPAMHRAVDGLFTDLPPACG
jgi:hypothetical protein